MAQLLTTREIYLQCYKCGRIGKHRAHECEGNNFNFRKAYNAKASSDNDEWDDTPKQSLTINLIRNET
jgi:hypothetical protein